MTISNVERLLIAIDAAQDPIYDFNFATATPSEAAALIDWMDELSAISDLFPVKVDARGTLYVDNSAGADVDALYSKVDAIGCKAYSLIGHPTSTSALVDSGLPGVKEFVYGKRTKPRHIGLLEMKGFLRAK